MGMEYFLTEIIYRLKCFIPDGVNTDIEWCFCGDEMIKNMIPTVGCGELTEKKKGGWEFREGLNIV